VNFEREQNYGNASLDMVVTALRRGLDQCDAMVGLGHTAAA
jgi:hypothetical protein